SVHHLDEPALPDLLNPPGDQRLDRRVVRHGRTPSGNLGRSGQDSPVPCPTGSGRKSPELSLAQGSTQADAGRIRVRRPAGHSCGGGSRDGKGPHLLPAGAVLPGGVVVRTPGSWRL